MSFSQKSHIPIVGNLLSIKLHQQLIDAYHESLIRECSYDFVLEERFDMESRVYIKYGISTVAGRIKQGFSMIDAVNEVPRVRGWVGDWVKFVSGAPSERVFRGLIAYRKQLYQQETRLKDEAQTVFVSALIVIVALVVAVLGFLITLPLQYADKLI